MATPSAAVPGVPDRRTPEQIEADMARTRERLAATMDALHEAATPEAMTQRVVGKARTFFLDEYGGIRPERVAIAAGVVLAFLALRRGRR